jgi:GTP-binding protein YchF
MPGKILQIGIIGLGQSGKTTIFNALCSGHAQVGDFSTGKSPNIAVIKVPDERLHRLSEIFQSAKITYAEMEFIDVAGMTASQSKDSFKEPAFISAIKMTSELLAVIRCFENSGIPHPYGSIDPARDIAAIESELIFSDLVLIEKRLEKVVHMLKVKPTSAGKAEEALLVRMKAQLDNEKPLREMEFSKDELGLMGSFGFLSLKPILYLLNLGEDQISSGTELEKKYFPTSAKNRACASLCGKIEMELAAIPESDRRDFLSDLGIDEPAAAKVIHRSFNLLGLICFLTAGETEARAWPIPRGYTAWDAAGEIHSDIQRGFIKAETVAYADLDSIGDWAESRKRGKLRMEGKDYVVKDGDVMLFRFNV